MHARPRLLPVVLAAAAFPVLFVTGRVVHLPDLGLGALGRDLLGEAALLAVTVAIVFWARWWRETGLLGPWRERWWTAVPVAMLAVQLLLAIPGLLARGDPVRLPAVLALVSMIGFCEETLTRGVMLFGLSRFGPLAAGLASSAIFAVLHGFGIFEGLPVSFLAFQMISAALVGLLFAGMRLRMISLWPVIAVHAALDVPSLLEGYPHDVQPIGLFAAVVSIGLVLPFGMAGLGLVLWDQLTGRRAWAEASPVDERVVAGVGALRERPPAP
jgi:membrane protease YdiL (CAAX protease family)